MIAIHEWRMLVRRTAAGVGALCGLLALVHDAPAWVACVRAGTACFLIAALGRLGERALSSSPAPAAVDEHPEGTSREPSAPSRPARAASGS